MSNQKRSNSSKDDDKFTEKKDTRSKNYTSKGKKNYSKNSKFDPRDQKSKEPEDKATSYRDRRGTSLDSYVGKSNDPQWYMRNERLIADAAKIPFGYQLGATYHLDSKDPNCTIGQSDHPVPGIIALDMMNIPGIASTSSDGVNLAAAGLFQFIRKNLSTVATYAPADVMMYVLGIDAIYSMYSNILRAFGIINAYSAINLYMPDDLLAAGYGFTPASIAYFKKNVNDCRSRFNNLIYKASTLYLPTDFTVTSRHSWLYSNYFWDSESLKSQIYIHKMGWYSKLDETTYSTGTALRTFNLNASGNGIIYLLDAFESMIDAYRNSDSMLHIAADMRRAFEGRTMWKLAYCDEAYITLPTYSREVLNQIHNMTILPYQYDAADADQRASWDVRQDVNHNTVVFTPYYTYAATTDDIVAQMAQACSDRILNFSWDDVTPADIVEATRLSVAVSCNITAKQYNITQAGADLCLGARFYLHNAGGAPISQSFYNIIDLNNTPVLNIGSTIASLGNFAWAPLVYMKAALPGSDMYYPIGELENYTVLGWDNLSRLHSNVICSMWAIPQFGGFDA